jgi:sensor histidine kinase YesM
MNQPRKFWIKQLRDLVFLIVAGFLMTFFFYRSSSTSFSIFLQVSFFTALMWILLWKGNDLLSCIIDYYISWIDEPVKRFVVGMVGTIVYSGGIVYLLTLIFESFTNLHFGDIPAMVMVSLLITLVISLFLHGREFYLNWKKALLDTERLEKENIRAQYDNLKSQVNPHFLFNSLNALTNLVYEDQDKAAKFIKQLSEVYRYVLDTRDKEIVPIQEELNFLKSYLFLQQIRFENNLVTKIDLNDLVANVAPLSIQMLFENAIKHNVISKESPLEIKLYSEADFVIVENTLQPKNISLEDSKGMGLENIVNRYSFLSDRKVIIENDTKVFRVRIPIIPTD